MKPFKSVDYKIFQLVPLEKIFRARGKYWRKFSYKEAREVKSDGCIKSLQIFLFEPQECVAELDRRLFK